MDICIFWIIFAPETITVISMMQINAIYRLFLVLILVLAANDVEAYNRQCRMGRLSIENGLAGETANKVIRDCGGQMWIATSNGVCVFNGERTTRVDIVSSDHGLRNNQNVYDICEAKPDHSIYISTPDGIYRLKTDDNTFRRVLQGMGKCQLLSKDGLLFIGNSKGLFVYDGKRLTNVDMGGEPNVRAMTLDADGTLYLLTTDAFCKYLENDNRLQRTNLLDAYPAGVSFSAFAKVGDLFFVGSKNYGMYMYSDKRGLTKVEGIG